MANSDFTQNQLKKLLHYDPDTGIFTWRKRHTKASWNGRYAGTQAGTRTRVKGYVQIKINHRQYSASRLAWLYMTGEWPEVFIDHIDRNPKNNCFSNLRPANRAQNMMNSKPRCDSPFPKGVTKDGNGFRARITVNKVRIYLGYFKTVEEATNAYQKSAKYFFGSYAHLSGL